MATTADFENGMCIAFKNALCKIVSFQHVKPGKGSAFVRTKLKNIVSKKIIENTFNAGCKIEPVRVEQHTCSFLYQDNTHAHFMDNTSFEIVLLPIKTIKHILFLKEGDKVNILFRADTEEPLICELPDTLWLRVTHTDTGVKGNTTNKATKPATLETGVTIQVPLFVHIDDIVKVDIATATYLAREKATQAKK